jgi:hypothetical protein
VIRRARLELPPAVARSLMADLKAYFAETNGISATRSQRTSSARCAKAGGTEFRT